MKGVFLVLMAVALLVAGALFCSLSADDVFKPSSPHERVDIPVEKPNRPTNWEDDDSGDDEGEEDDDDDDEEPPIEFFDEEIEGDKVTYVMDYTGSMAGRVGHSITDANGKVIGNPTKMQHIKAEFAKSVMALSENVKFSAVMFATPAWQCSRVDVKVWKSQLVDATPQNKQSAIAWANGFQPAG